MVKSYICVVRELVNMKLIVITLPQMVDGEADLIRSVLDNGASFVHIRKPDAGKDEVCDLVGSIGKEYMSRLTMHYYHDVAMDMGMGGVHLSAKSPCVPEGWEGRVSASCHSFDEVMQCVDNVDYCFISPIFNSISKKGYKSAFSESDLVVASRSGVINEKVVALGGVTSDRVACLGELGFGGVGVLGDIWCDLSIEGVGRKVAEYCRNKYICSDGHHG